MTKYAHDRIVPFKKSSLSKKQQVATMFDKIAFRYDFLNRFLSAGIDVGWRKKAIAQLQEVQPATLLDVATGTGDMAIMAYKKLRKGTLKITGVDISEGMLQVGREKIKRLGLQGNIELKLGDSETLNFNNNTFDAATVAFGVRNFQNLEVGLAEMFRVLKPGGKLVILEFSKPHNPFFKAFYGFYMNTIAPLFSKLFGSNKEAYEYLNHSVQQFPEREALVDVMETVGFTKTYFKPLTFGICCIYSGCK